MSSDITYELPPYQKDFITSNKEFVSIVGAKGSSKAQPLTEPVLTPGGFVPMGEIKKGDAVIGSDGRPTLVTGVYTQGEKPVIKMILDDNRTTRCTYDHLWRVYVMDGFIKYFATINTARIMDMIAHHIDVYVPVILNSGKKSYRKVIQCHNAGYSEECQCISVDAKDSLYVTKDYILTHNTWSGVRFVAMQLSMQPNTQGLVMFNTRQQAEDIFRQEMEPLLQELNWPYEFNGKSLNMKSMGSVVHWRSSEAGSVRNIESIVYHWGWADEASYYDPAALQTFASRIRKGLALKRVTSMPDEPDAYIYEFLERQPGPLYEISLDDNPDKEFRERYKRFLKSIYSGPELDRYLSGRRVSLEGMGLFAVEGQQRGEYGYDPDKPLMLSWDFNVEYRAVSAWQEVGKDSNSRPIIACVKSWQMKGATVQEDAVELSRKFKNHRNVIYLHGDASGQARSAQTTDSMWKMVRKEFQAECENIRYIVPPKNPPVKDTIQCLNWGLREGLVKFDKEEKNVYMSLSATKADKYGEPDKSMDYKQNSKARSHEADTARYAVWHYLHQIYPGNRGGFFIV